MNAAHAARERVEPLVERSRPALRLVARGLRGLGRLVQVVSMLGIVGALLLIAGLVALAGWWGLLGLVAGVLPWRAWVIGHHAVAGSRLLDDPRRVADAARSSGGTGQEWLTRVQAVSTAARGRRFGPTARAVVGAGRSVWTAVSPSIEGASSLRELAIWPKTVVGLASTAACPVLLLVGFVVALLGLVS